MSGGEPQSPPWSKVGLPVTCWTLLPSSLAVVFEEHVKQIFLKLGLETNPESHRRVLAVLAYLRTTT